MMMRHLRESGPFFSQTKPQSHVDLGEPASFLDHVQAGRFVTSGVELIRFSSFRTTKLFFNDVAFCSSLELFLA